MYHLPEILVHFWQKKSSCVDAVLTTKKIGELKESKEMIMKTMLCKGIHF